MTPIRAQISRAIDEGDRWLIVALLGMLMSVIVFAASVYHIDMKANTAAIDDLNAALLENTAEGRKRDEQLTESHQLMLRLENMGKRMLERTERLP